MIQSGELRTGNIIYSRITGISTVAKIGDGCVWLEIPSYNDPLSVQLIEIPCAHLFRVPLSPEILESVFAKADYFIILRIGGEVIKKKAIWVDNRVEKPFLRIEGIADVYYLHTLQNIFYVLSRRDLEIRVSKIKRCKMYCL